jgi:antitoxin component HigA of HigAB toxin-antitoxin module
MTKQEILALGKIENDQQLDEAVDLLDEYIMDKFDTLNATELKELEILSDLIYEYEEHTDILNRPYEIGDGGICS